MTAKLVQDYDEGNLFLEGQLDYDYYDTDKKTEYEIFMESLKVRQGVSIF